MKKRIRKTGEIVDVITYYNLLGPERNDTDTVSYVDSKGEEHHKEKGLNLSWDFEDVEEVLSTNIDREQMRFSVSKDVLTAIMGRISYDPLMQCSCRGIDEEAPNPYQSIAQISVQAADALISELKKGGEK